MSFCINSGITSHYINVNYYQVPNINLCTCMNTHLGASGANIFLQPHMYTDSVVETNMNAVAGGGEMYAEVDEMQKMKVEASTAEQGRNPQAYLTFVNSQ